MELLQFLQIKNEKVYEVTDAGKLLMLGEIERLNELYDNALKHKEAFE